MDPEAYKAMAREIAAMDAESDREERLLKYLRSADSAGYARGLEAAAKCKCEGCRKGWPLHPDTKRYHLVDNGFDYHGEQCFLLCGALDIRALTTSTDGATNG